MKKIGKIGAIIVFCFSQFFIQCTSDEKNEIEDKTALEQNADEIIQLRNYLSTTLNMDLKYITYDSKTNTFIIDEDVLMPLKDARDHFNNWNEKNTNKTTQRGGEYKLTPETAASIKIYVSPEVPSEWKIAINSAIENWNTVNSSITITIENDEASANVDIESFNGGSAKAIAYSSLPAYNGAPGNLMSLNTYFNYLSASTKVIVIMHEIGHCFGLNHTNQVVGSLIPCTPLSDLDSVMHSTANDRIKGFSYYDNVAISTLYPVVVGAEKIYRYKKNKSFSYSTDACEIIPNKDGYIFDGDAGYIYSSEIPGTVPIYRVTHGSTKEHRLNKNRESSADVIIGYIYPTQQPGTSPLYSQGIYELRSEENPSYMYHYLYTTISPDAITKAIIGYVITK